MEWEILRRIIRKNVFKRGKVAIRTNDIVVINPLSAGLFQTKLHDSSNDLPAPVRDNCGVKAEPLERWDKHDSR